MEGLEKMFRKELDSALTDTFETPRRSPRAVEFVGEALEWCCGVATTHKLQSLHARQHDVEAVVAKLQKGLGRELAALVNTSVAFETFQKEYERNEKFMIDHVKLMEEAHGETMQVLGEEDMEIQAVVHRMYQNLVHNVNTVRLVRRQNIINSCRANQLPHAIVTPQVLQQDLTNLEYNLTKSGYQLAVPTEDVQSYFQLPIVDCAFTEEWVTITIKVPISKAEHEWQLKELITVPFAWGNQTCEIPLKSVYLAVAEVNGKEVIRAISGSGQHACRPHFDQLCYVPRFGNHAGGILCAFKLFVGVAVEELGNICPMTCYSTNTLSITEVGVDTYVLTNPPKDTRIVCNAISSSLPEAVFHRPGALQLKFPCHCHLEVNQQVMIPTRFPCGRDLEATPEVTHILPAVWSNLKSFVLQPIHRQRPPKYHNFTDVLDPTWNLKVPHINISNPTTLIQDLEDALVTPVSYADRYAHHSDSIIFIWNTILSIVLLRILYRNPVLWMPMALPQAHADLNTVVADAIMGTGVCLFGIFLGALLLFMCSRLCPQKLWTPRDNWALVSLQEVPVNQQNEIGDQQGAISSVCVEQTEKQDSEPK